MYTWGYIKEATLAKLDMSSDEAVSIGLLNKFPFAANEAMTQICSAIKAKSTFAEFNVCGKTELYCYIRNKYHLPCDFDMSFLYTPNCNAEDLPIAPYNLQEIRQWFIDAKIVFVGEVYRMPLDFVNFSDDINRVTRFGCDYTEEVSDADWSTMGTNSIMFKKPGYYIISYDARWFTFTPDLKDDYLFDIPADILDCLPSYIAYQCFKVDDEAKANTYRTEFEIMLARIEDNKARTNKTMLIDGGW